jgi:hypothetical protein
MSRYPPRVHVNNRPEPPPELTAEREYLHQTAQTLIHTIRNSRQYDGDLVGVVEQILRRTIKQVKGGS